MENSGAKYRIMEDNEVQYISEWWGRGLGPQFLGFADFVRIPQGSRTGGIPEATRSLWHGSCDVNSSNYTVYIRCTQLITFKNFYEQFFVDLIDKF